MRHAVLFAVVLSMLAVCPGVRAEDEPKLTIAFNHAKLTTWVLEDFADGLPFDKTGKPTDDEKAKQFWELIADWPIKVVGEVTSLAPAISQVCDEAGLPVYFTPGAVKALEKAGTDKRLFTVSDSVRKAVVIIGRLAGVEKTVIMPFGLIVVGPGEDPSNIKQLVAASPRPQFRWRANYAKLIEKAFGEDWNPLSASEDDFKKLMQIATEIRCDLIVPGEMELEGFIKWLAAASKQTFTLDEKLFDPANAAEKKIGPIECRFALFLDALNAAIEPADLEATAEETHFVIGSKEELEKSYEE